MIFRSELFLDQFTKAQVKHVKRVPEKRALIHQLIEITLKFISIQDHTTAG
jgi:hypothetical protein